MRLPTAKKMLGPGVPMMYINVLEGQGDNDAAGSAADSAAGDSAAGSPAKRTSSG